MRKRLGRTLLVLVILAVVVVAALKVFLPVDRLASMAAERLRLETGAEISYGDVSLDVWPRVALTVTDVDVRGIGEAAPETGGLESWRVRVAKLSGGLALRPLLSRRAELDRVRLEAPVIEMTTRPAPPGAAAAAGGGNAGEMPVALVAAGAEISDGALVWNEVGGRSVELRGWQQDVRASELGRLAALLAAWSGSGQAPEGDELGSLTLDGRAELLSLDGFRPGAAMEFRDFTLRGRLEVPTAGPVLGLEELDATWAGLHATGRGGVRAPGPDGRLDLDWVLEEVDAALAQPALAALLPDSAQAFRDWLATAPLSWTGLDLKGRLSLPLPLTEEPASAAVIRGLTLEGRVDEAVFTPPRLQSPWSLSGDVRMAEARLTASDVVASVGAGEVRGEMSLDDVGGEDAACSLDADLADVPVNLLLEVFAPKAAPFLDGDADGALHGTFRLGDPVAVRESLALTGTTTLNSGVIHASEWLEGISGYLGDRQDLKEIRYGSLLHELEIVDGRYQIRDLNLRGPDTDWTGQGWIGLAGDIDMKLKAKLPEGFTPNLGAMTPMAEALRGEDGRLALDLTLTGRAARPSVGLDLGNAQNLLQSTVEEALQGEEAENLIEGVRGLLDKFKKRR